MVYLTTTNYNKIHIKTTSRLSSYSWHWKWRKHIPTSYRPTNRWRHMCASLNPWHCCTTEKENKKTEKTHAPHGTLTRPVYSSKLLRKRGRKWHSTKLEVFHLALNDSFVSYKKKHFLMPIILRCVKKDKNFSLQHQFESNRKPQNTITYNL